MGCSIHAEEDVIRKMERKYSDKANKKNKKKFNLLVLKVSKNGDKIGMSKICENMSSNVKIMSKYVKILQKMSKYIKKLQKIAKYCKVRPGNVKKCQRGVVTATSARIGPLAGVDAKSAWTNRGVRQLDVQAGSGLTMGRRRNNQAILIGIGIVRVSVATF